MQSVFLDFATLGDGLDIAPLERVAPGIRLHAHTAPEEIAARIADARAVVTNKVRLDRAALEAAPALEFIGLTATGSDNIDLDAARERGIAVANVRAYCTDSVAQHVFAGILTLTHRLRDYRELVAAGAWQRADEFCLLDFPIRELSGRVLGIVGLGELGSRVAALGECFGMEVLAAERAGADDERPDRVPLERLLERADVLSLHCPLTDSTRGLIGASELANMKSDALLVNTARGGLVDTAALARALEERAIGGAVIDVLPTEPPLHGDPLLDYEGSNLILTPHIAWAAAEARQRALDEVAANLRAFLAGETRNRID